MDALLLMLHVQTAAPAAVVLAEAPVVQSEAVIRLLAGANLHLKMDLASYPEAPSQTRSSCDVASSSLQVTQGDSMSVDSLNLCLGI